MKPEIKAKWVQALRSGEYKQTQKALRRGDSFCCLGVLCDIHAKEHGGSWGPTDSIDGLLPGYFNSCSTLPPIVSQWAGTSSNPEMPDGLTLAEHNDGDDGVNLGDEVTDGIPGKSFPEIADLIEANL